MARNTPTIPDDKFQFFSEKLIREVSNLFVWEGLPDEIPVDYLEHSLVRDGRVMFFKDEDAFGYMALSATVRGYNIYGKPVEAVSTAPNTQGDNNYFKRLIVQSYVKDISPEDGCVLIENMYNGQSLMSIINFYAARMTNVQKAFDTNALWQNLPVMWAVPDSKTKLSIEKLFEDIASGKPWVIVDQQLQAIGKEGVSAGAVEVPFLLDKLFDVQNEIYSAFKATVGINTSGADKKERLVVDEAKSNDQAIQTCLQIMLSQRQKACMEINKLYGLNVSVNVLQAQKEDDDGNRDGGAEKSASDELPII